ncbi:hypothetical protein LEP1GSC199_3540 [Leptospira vanthielii serovar Holland str. Waz Holland = ATCC 700522]|uniref:Uncharacterized protein n=1 Tax=Leptospira vanthielii serovar Holland str. Waz Holland = ATCC 700522 TaxID=1218591 RepID=N1WDJ0_9LEPT|nr:hypothetical protein LEP1GSC199_3540 [Leptospira vanthielii serovar Holland str. Waz Holland = ATCC 700522]
MRSLRCFFGLDPFSHWNPNLPENSINIFDFHRNRQGFGFLCIVWTKFKEYYASIPLGDITEF